MPADARSTIVVGIVAWIATVAVGASWQLATRFGVTTHLSPIDLALLRYLIPAVALTPVLVRKGILPRSPRPWILALIVAGGGLPFGLLGMAGAQFAPVSHMGALLPGSMPVFVALLSALFLGERFGWARLLGLGVILLGVGCIVGDALSGFGANRSVILGDALFLSAGLLWAVYTVAYRKSGIDPWHGAALICFWSAVLVAPVWTLAPETGLRDAPTADIALQIAAQGFLAGLLGLAAYGAAIQRLGAAVAAVSGAVVPGLTALGGFILLDEPLSASAGLGVALVAIGLWAFAGAPGSRRVFT
ncbi:MAG: DMT family transporter [Alphaproteobacteria bacterium]|nr:DMT family transporter [Alphaproteobacteria bacterium]